MKKLLFSMALLFVTSSLFAGQGKVRVACNKKGAYIYVDGKKKAMTGEGFTNILLEEGDHVIKVVKVNYKYQRYSEKKVFIGEETSIKVAFTLDKHEPTSHYRNVLRKKDLLKFKRFKQRKNLVEDVKLNLIWQDNYSSKTSLGTWESAKKYCRNLSLEGYINWRLPKYKELLSIVDRDRYAPAIIPSFKNVALKVYWSSSEDFSVLLDSSVPKYAYVVNFNGGSGGNDGEKIKDYFIRCVHKK